MDRHTCKLEQQSNINKEMYEFENGNSKLLLLCIYLKVINQPTNALNKIQFKTIIKLLYVSALGCHPKGVL
jgi:hypothetical protein